MQHVAYWWTHTLLLCGQELICNRCTTAWRAGGHTLGNACANVDHVLMPSAFLTAAPSCRHPSTRTPRTTGSSSDHHRSPCTTCTRGGPSRATCWSHPRTPPCGHLARGVAREGLVLRRGVECAGSASGTARTRTSSPADSCHSPQRALHWRSRRTGRTWLPPYGSWACRSSWPAPSPATQP